MRARSDMPARSGAICVSHCDVPQVDRAGLETRYPLAGLSLVVILPFSLLAALVQWQRQIQIGASLLLIGFGIFRLVNRRHPRALARIPPTQLGGAAVHVGPGSPAEGDPCGPAAAR